MTSRGPIVALALLILGSERQAPKIELNFERPPIGPPDPDPVHPAVLDPLAPTAGPKNFSYDPRAGPVPAAAEWTPVPAGDGYRIRTPRSTWGTASAVSSLVGALERFRLSDPSAEVVVLDMSRKGGGPLKRHKSHQLGRDVDLAFSGLGGNWLPTEPTARLLQSFLQDPNVGAVFLDWHAQKDIWHALSLDPDIALGVEPELQYPLEKGTGRTRIRHWPGHVNHLHVRFNA